MTKLIDEIINEFLVNLDNLPDNERVYLRRSIGLRMCDASAAALAAFYKALPIDRETEKKQYEECWFVAACIHCQTLPRQKSRMSIETATAAYLASGASDSYRKRVINMMDTPYESDGCLISKLARHAMLLKNKGYALSGATIVTDLMFWNHPDRTVQKIWARTINRSGK